MSANVARGGCCRNYFFMTGTFLTLGFQAAVYVLYCRSRTLDVRVLLLITA